MRDKAGSAAAPAARWRNCLRWGSFMGPSQMAMEAQRISPLLTVRGALPAYVASCAGFRTPAALISPRAPATGVRKAPMHEIASGDGAPAVPQAAGAADGYGV